MTLDLQKPDSCTCDYPNTIYRNGNGHYPTCPCHKPWYEAPGVNKSHMDLNRQLHLKDLRIKKLELLVEKAKNATEWLIDTHPNLVSDVDYEFLHECQEALDEE